MVSGYEIFVVKRNCASDFPENVVIIFSTVGTFEKEKKNTVYVVVDRRKSTKVIVDKDLSIFH